MITILSKVYYIITNGIDLLILTFKVSRMDISIRQPLRLET